MDEQVRALVDSEWQSRLGVDESVLGSGSVHVVVADLGANDALSTLLDHTCIVVVRPDDLDAAQTAFDGLDARAAFTAEALRKFVGTEAQVDGPSCHSYANERSFRGGADPAAEPVRGDDGSLLAFLERNNLVTCRTRARRLQLGPDDIGMLRTFRVKIGTGVVAGVRRSDERASAAPAA